MVTGVFPSPPRYVHSFLSPIGSAFTLLVDFHRMLQTHALALFPNQFFCKKKCVWSKLTGFLGAVRKSLGFSVSIEINLVFVWVVDVDLVSVWGVELDLISVWGSTLIFFVSGVENDLVLVCGSELTCNLCDVQPHIGMGS